MELDEIRQRLATLENNVSTGDVPRGYSSDSEIIARLRREKSSTALDELKSQYRRFCVIAFVFGVIQLFVMQPILPFWGRILVGGYFFIAGLMDLYLWEGLKTIDVVDMSVTEVARKAVHYRRMHHIFQLILIPLAVGCLVAFCISFSDIPAMITGIICGCALGLACGLRLYFRIMRNYRTLTDTEADL